MLSVDNDLIIRTVENLVNTRDEQDWYGFEKTYSKLTALLDECIYHVNFSNFITGRNITSVMILPSADVSENTNRVEQLNHPALFNTHCAIESQFEDAMKLWLSLIYLITFSGSLVQLDSLEKRINSLVNTDPLVLIQMARAISGLKGVREAEKFLQEHVSILSEEKFYSLGEAAICLHSDPKKSADLASKFLEKDNKYLPAWELLFQAITIRDGKAPLKMLEKAIDEHPELPYLRNLYWMGSQDVIKELWSEIPFDRIDIDQNKLLMNEDTQFHFDIRHACKLGCCLNVNEYLLMLPEIGAIVKKKRVKNLKELAEYLNFNRGRTAKYTLASFKDTRDRVCNFLSGCERCELEEARPLVCKTYPVVRKHKEGRNGYTLFKDLLILPWIHPGCASASMFSPVVSFREILNNKKIILQWQMRDDFNSYVQKFRELYIEISDTITKLPAKKSQKFDIDKFALDLECHVIFPKKMNGLMKKLGIDDSTCEREKIKATYQWILDEMKKYLNKIKSA